MIREIRRASAKVIPEFIKAPIRCRLYGYYPSKARLNVEVTKKGSDYQLRIDESIELLVTEDALEDFSFHFIHNGASIEEMSGFLREAQSKRVLLDVGAYKGLFSLMFCASDKRNRAIAYEPSPVLRAMMQEMIRLNEFQSRLALESYAIGESKREINASVDATGFINLENGAHDTRVEMTTLDDECERLGAFPDIVKIDIESYEHEALLGARKLLSQRPVICLELHLDALEKRGISPRIVCDGLTSSGYRLYSCVGKELSPRDVYDSASAVLRFIAR